jgi:DNA-binding GntR family transcriptional regulator
LASAADIDLRGGAEGPRYLQLAAELRDLILSGRLGTKDQFPTESALCRTYGVSRFTVREALRRLQAEGLIARRRGSGTVVQPAAARGGALHQPLSNVGEILQYARDTRATYTAEGRVPLPRAIAEQIAGDTDGRWFRFRGIRTREGDDLPIAVTDAYVHGRHADAVARIDPAQSTLFRQLEDNAGIAVHKVTQDIQAVSASAAVAEALGIPRRSATLRILRCYFDQKGQLFEISVSHHPGDRFAYSMHIDVDG